MSASKYKIWAYGAPVGQGATGSVHVGMAAIAKKATAATPYIVANELICSMLAKVTMLQCPPGALLEHNGETYFCSLDFNTAGHALPPAAAATIVADLPELSWGITLFDVLVMNGDRHHQNISYNQPTKEVTIFDHSHAFMQPAGDIDARLNATKNALSINGHCLAPELNSWKGFRDWAARIKAIPDYYLEGAVDAGCQVGFPKAKQAAIYDFLRDRRNAIDTLVTNNRGGFPKLTAAPP